MATTTTTTTVPATTIVVEQPKKTPVKTYVLFKIVLPTIGAIIIVSLAMLILYFTIDTEPIKERFGLAWWQWWLLGVGIVLFGVPMVGLVILIISRNKFKA